MSPVVGAPVGRWTGTVIYGPKVEEFTVVFEDGGVATLSTSATSGQGDWSSTGEETFDFTIKERLHTGDSGVSGTTVVTGIDHLVISISARLSGPSFDGAGTARVYDAAGAEIFAIAARMTAQQSAPTT
jgi:hypothetical protein